LLASSTDGGTLDSADDLIARGWNGEHTECVSISGFLPLYRGGGAAILESVDLISMLVGSAHGTLDAAVGEETTEDHVLDSVLTQQKVQVGRMESAKAGLALADEIGGAGLHGVAEGRTPLVGLERLALLDGLEDAKVAGNLLVTVFEGDGDMNDGAAGHPGRVHRLLAVGDGIVLVQAGLDGLVEGTALGGELVLVLDKYQGGLGRIQLVDCHLERCGGGVSLA